MPDSRSTAHAPIPRPAAPPWRDAVSGDGNRTVPNSTADLTRSRNMQRMTVNNTKPDMVVRKYLHSRGFRYSLHRHDLALVRLTERILSRLSPPAGVEPV